MSPRRLIATPRRAVTTVVVLIAVLSLIGAGVAVVITVSAIQKSRYENTVAGCERVNEEHALNLLFVREISPELLPLAESIYRIDPDCEATARERVR